MEDNTNIIDGAVKDFFQEGITKIPQLAFKRMIDKKKWIEMFVEAGQIIADYETQAGEEQSQIRSIMFQKENMKILANHLCEKNPFIFESELERCLDDFLWKSDLTKENQRICKKHFTDIIMRDIAELYPEMKLSMLIQGIDTGVNQLGELGNKYYPMMEEMLHFINELKVRSQENNYQRYSNRSSTIARSQTKIDWRLSSKNYCEESEGVLRKLVEKWKEERLQYPGWIIVPSRISIHLKYNTRIHFGKEFPGFSVTEKLSVIYELVWRFETGMLPFDGFLQKQVQDCWLQYYHSQIKEKEDYEQIKEWFFIGRTLLREFREDKNEIDWKGTWDILMSQKEKVTDGELLLRLDEIKYQMSFFNMNKVRRLLQRMEVPSDHYVVRLNCIGIEVECGNLEFAKKQLKELISDMEKYLDEAKEKNAVRINSIYVAALHLYSFVIQGIATKEHDYEYNQEEINKILDLIDEKKEYFDLNQIIDDVSKALLEWQVKRTEKGNTYELNRETVSIFGGRAYCEEAYFLHRVLDCISFPLMCNYVNFFGQLEIPWCIALFEGWSFIALNRMVQGSKSEIGKYVYTRKQVIAMRVEDISSELVYLFNILNNNIEEFSEIGVDIHQSVCYRLQNNIPEIVVRLLSRASDEIQIETLRIVKRLMEQPNIELNNRMDEFLYSVISMVSEKNKAEMLEELITTDIVEHKVMHGHLPSMDLFSIYLKKNASKKYCKRTDKIEKAINKLLSTTDDEDIYTWRVKIERLTMLEDVGLLTEEEREKLIEKLWSRVNPLTKLPDMGNWYAYNYVKYATKNRNSLIFSVKEYIMSQCLMRTQAKEIVGGISMSQSAYIREMYALLEYMPKGFWSVREVELVFQDAIDYWDNIKEVIEKEELQTYFAREKKKQIWEIVNMLANLYDSITECLSDKMCEKIRKFVAELEHYHIFSTKLQILFETEQGLNAAISNIINHLYESEEQAVLDALQACYCYIKKYPRCEQSHKLLGHLILLLRTYKEPGLVSVIYMIHDLLYIDNDAISDEFIKELDECLLALEKMSLYRDEVEGGIKHKVRIRKACASLAFQIQENYPEWKGSGVCRWQAVCRGNDFAEVKNEMV